MRWTSGIPPRERNGRDDGFSRTFQLEGILGFGIDCLLFFSVHCFSIPNFECLLLNAAFGLTLVWFLLATESGLVLFASERIE